MGRYLSRTTDTGDLTFDYDDSNTTFDADGFITSYTAAGIEYSDITYETVSGGGEEFGGTYRRVKSYTESSPNGTQEVVVNYDSTTGRVASLDIS